MNPLDFATVRSPIRASSLVNLAQCAPSVLLRAEMLDDGNEAAQTGSMIHKGIQAYHQTRSEGVGLAVMAASTQEFPRANTAKAKNHYQTYIRRQGKEWGQVIECEQKVTFTIPPAEIDATQEEIVIIGTLDQLRLMPDGTLMLVDIKTGSKRADEILTYYAPQLAAYQYASIKRHPGKVVNAAILRTADFFYGGPVIHRVRWRPEQCLAVLDFVREEVAQVRAGKRVYRAGSHCKWCPARGPENCTDGRIPLETVSSFEDGLTSIDDLGAI